MKVLLIEPPKAPATFGGEDVFLYEPLALEYLAAGVQPDHEVSILDLRLGGTLEETLQDYRPDVVGITGYTVHHNVVRRLLAAAKRWSPDVLTVVGGHHATVQPEDFADADADAIVLGEGVFTFREVLSNHEQGRGLEDITGLAIPRNGALHRTAARPTAGLDDIPFPDRSLTRRYRAHYYSEWMKPLASIRTSKGCPFRCSFCALWKIAGGKYLRRDPACIVEELGTIEEPFVFFADDESLLDVARMTELAERIERSGIRKRYFLYGRSDTIAKNPELLQTWRKVGLERVFVGLESFRDQDLASIHKGSTVADNDVAVKILQDLGIEIYASFIVRPDFSREDFARLGDYCRKLELNFVSFAVLTPLPGTDLMAEVGDSLITHDHDLFDFIHTLMPTKLSLDEFYEEFTRLYRDAVPVRRRLSLLRRYPVRDLFPLFVKNGRLQKRLRRLADDYAGSASANHPLSNHSDGIPSRRA